MFYRKFAWLVLWALLISFASSSAYGSAQGMNHLSMLPSVQSQAILPQSNDGSWQYYWYSGDVRALAIHGDNVWAAAERGIYRFSRSSKQVTLAVPYNSDSFPSTYVITGIAVDQNENVWVILYGKGIARYDGQGWTNYTQANGLVTLKISSIAVDHSGSVWITWNSDTSSGITKPGISKFDGSMWQTIATQDFKTNISISAIDFADNGDVWLAASDGVYLLSNGVVQQKMVQSGYYGVLSIGVAPNSHIWIGVSGGLREFDGANWIDHKNSDANYYSLQFDNQGRVWSILAGSVNGNSFSHITIFDGQQWKQYTTADGLASRRINIIRFDDIGHLWVGLSQADIIASYGVYTSEQGGLQEFDGTNWQRYEINSPINGEIQGVYEDKHGDKWFITDNGHLNVLKYSQGVWNSYPFPNPPLGRKHELSAGMPDGGVWLAASYVTSCGWLYCSQSYEVFSFDGQNWTRLQNPLNSVQSIAVDNSGVTWFATRGYGVTSYQNGAMTTYNKTNSSLLGDNINPIVGARNGDVWLRGTMDNGNLFTQRFNGNGWDKIDAVNPDYPMNSDNNGHMWFSKLGTQSAGMVEYDGKNIIEYKPSTEPGSPSGYGARMLTDAQHRLLLPRSNTLEIYDGVNWFIQTFDSQFLPLNPNSNFFQIDNGSNYWFISPLGIAVFTPNSSEPTYSVSGHVSSMQGALVKGAEIHVDNTLVTSTDDNGNFVVFGLKAGTHTIQVVKTGMTFAAQQVTLPNSIKGLNFAVFPTPTPTSTPISTVTPTVTPTPFSTPEGFVINRDAWNFKNADYKTITWEIFRQAFGKEQVEDADGKHLPAAQSEYEKEIKNSAQGGLCFGFAATSGMLYAHIPSDFSLPEGYTQWNKNLFGVPSPDMSNGYLNPGKLGDFLATYFIYQSGNQFTSELMSNYGLSYQDFVTKITQSIDGNLKDPVLLDIQLIRGQVWPFNNCVAHAILPYKYSKTVDGIDIWMYDSNHPNPDSVMHMKTDGSWNYDNWNSSQECYPSWYGFLPFTQKYHPWLAPISFSKFASSSPTLMTSSHNGNISTLVLSNAAMEPSNKLIPVYPLNNGLVISNTMEQTLLVSGTVEVTNTVYYTTANQAEVTLFAPSALLAVRTLRPTMGENDGVVLSGNRNKVAISAGSTLTRTMHTITSNQQVELTRDMTCTLPKGTLAKFTQVKNSSIVETDTVLSGCGFVAADGTADGFYYLLPNIDANSTITFTVDSSTDNLEMKIDKESNGTVDETHTVAPQSKVQEIHLFLPIVQK